MGASDRERSAAKKKQTAELRKAEKRKAEIDSLFMTTALLCQQVYDLARMAAQPLEAEEITAFLTRSQKLLGMLVK